jgi:mRNA-degrading endonuclease RelE of RelBE toxin-antitoxin system
MGEQREPRAVRHPPVETAERLESLGQQTFPLGRNTLKAPVVLWRMRVGDYRVIYQVN